MSLDPQDSPPCTDPRVLRARLRRLGMNEQEKEVSLEHRMTLMESKLAHLYWIYRLLAGTVITALAARFVMMGGGHG